MTVGMTMRTAAALAMCGGMLLTLPGCKNKQEAAKQALADSGYELTPEGFFRAAGSDDTTAMDKMLRSGIALQTLNTAGDTALHVAAVAGMKNSVKFLLDKHMPVDVTGDKGRTPLMATVVLGRPDMVRYLLKQGADPLRKDSEGYTPLLMAVREGRADMIGELAPYDREDMDNAILAAALLGRAKEIDELANYGASVYARMDDGRTALMLAAENGREDAVKMLVGIGANRFAMDEEGRIAADLAREAGHEDIAKWLTEEPTKEEFGLEEPDAAGLAMERDADHITSGGKTGHPGKGGTPPSHGAPRSLEGAAISRTPEPSANPDGYVAEISPQSRPPLPLVMRGYRQKELPLRVDSVSGTTAMLRVAGGKPQPFQEGATVPGSALKVVRIQKKMHSSKEKDGVPLDVSIVEVEDANTRQRREFITGIAANANEPAALVEDSGSGQRYLARSGQTFQGADGVTYRVADVRPNQMVIENPASGAVWTVPLRGPRG